MRICSGTTVRGAHSTPSVAVNSSAAFSRSVTMIPVLKNGWSMDISGLLLVGGVEKRWDRTGGA